MAFGDFWGDCEPGRRQHHPGRSPWGEWSDWGQWGGRGPAGHRPPPWLAGLFGQGGSQQRGPRVRRGDVRSAILDVLRTAHGDGESINGYQIIQQIAERSGGEWRPSPGSVYPTIQQLEDEGLVEADDERGRRSLRLTAEGQAYAAEQSDELDAVWRPFEREKVGFGKEPAQGVDLKAEIGQVMSAVWQIISSGSERQRQAAVEVLVEARRRLYGILADGHTGPEGQAEPPEDGEVGRS